MKEKLLGFVIAALMRVVGITLRLRLDDRAALRGQNPEGSLIWVFWHNRVFGLPLVYRKFLRRRHGSVLTSPSSDGELIARVMGHFGVSFIEIIFGIVLVITTLQDMEIKLFHKLSIS